MYAAYSISHILNMPDLERRAFLERCAGEMGLHPVMIRREEDEFDVYEQSQVFASLPVLEYLSSQVAVPVTAAHLIPETVDIGGTLFAMSRPSQTSYAVQSGATPQKHSGLVATPTTRRHLSSLGVALSLGFPILLEGRPGVGKTALVEEAARLAGCQGMG